MAAVAPHAAAAAAAVGAAPWPPADAALWGGGEEGEVAFNGAAGLAALRKKVQIPAAVPLPPGVAGYPRTTVLAAAPQPLQPRPGLTVVPQPAGGPPGAHLIGAPPPGWFGPSAVQHQLLSIPQVPPRRFPGHFVPHRLCNHFSAHGWCRKAETCTFAHGLAELHPDVQMQLAPQLGLVPAHFQTGKGKGKVVAKGVGKGAVLEVEQMPMYDYNGALDPAAAAAMAAAAGAAPYDAGDGNFHFNAGAQPFVPILGADDAAAAGEVDGEEAQHSGTSDDERNSSSSPGRRRPQPAPLQLDDSPAAAPKAMAAFAPVMLSPGAAAVKTILAQPLVSPMHVATRLFTPHVAGRQPLASPKAVMLSPTNTLGGTLSSLTLQASPKAVPSMQTPTRGATVLLRGVPGMPGVPQPWPGSPTVVMSPTSPVPISRGMLLQARTVVQRAEQGPPGLAHFAPTPTTRASRLGFRFPQPGLLQTVSTVVPIQHQHPIAKAKAPPPPPAK